MNALQLTGSPSFCWYCLKQLQRAPGKGQGLFYCYIVQDKAGVQHRVHGEVCLKQALNDGCKDISRNY